MHRFDFRVVTVLMELENYLPSEVASSTEVLKVCGEPLIDVTQTQLSIGRLKENCLNHND